MAFRHILEFRTADEANKLKIECLDRNNYSSSSKTKLQSVAALQALLICHLKLQEKSDFDMQITEHPDSAAIMINGSANIVMVLNYFLNDDTVESVFYLSQPYSYREDFKTRWGNYLGKLIVSCIENKNLTLAEFKKIHSIMIAYLDAQYELLKKENCVIKLTTKANENYGTDLLMHPFYQTLSLLMDDYQTRLEHHKQKNFFDKLGKTPSDKEQRKVYHKFMDSIPTCFCDVSESNYSIQKELNADKIRSSRVKAEVIEIKSMTTSSTPQISNSMNHT